MGHHGSSWGHHGGGHHGGGHHGYRSYEHHGGHHGGYVEPVMYE